MAILLPELADENLTGAIDRVSGFISAENGNIKDILNDSPWGRRRLAYTIRYNGQDYRDGIYVIWHFDLEPSRMTEVERELKLDTQVIRYLVVHDDPKWNSPAERQQQAEAAATAVAGENEAAPAEETPTAEAPTAEADTAVNPGGSTNADEAPAAAPASDEETTSAEAPAEVAAVADEADAEAAPAPAASSPVEGASGVETTAVVEDTTGAAVEAPVDETAAESSDETTEDK
jgi:small subunit ribosomal protein S6